MSRLLVFAVLGVIFINISCERCMRCRYSYTETIIVETPDGEEEEKVEYTNQILKDEDGADYGDECIKRNEYKDKEEGSIFSIDTYYDLESQTTDLEDFEYECYEL